MSKGPVLPGKSYAKILRQVVAVIKHTRVVVANRVNSSMLRMYWEIGRHLSEEGLEQGYGGAVVKRLSADLKAEFPDTSGFSPRSLWDMKRFYEFYSVENIDKKLPQSVAVFELSWGHHRLILNKISDLDEARYYVESAIKMGWTRDLLLNFIKADAYKSAKLLPKTNNFKKALPENLQEQANEIIKSTYSLDLLGIAKPRKELDLERRIVEKIRLFLLELGEGFTFIGNQYRILSGKKEYFVDLLFFNRVIKSLVAIDLKIGVFEPEYVGKMNFYLGLLDDKVKMDDENPSIGLILCASKNSVDVEIALRDVNKPIGVAEYELRLPTEQIKKLINEEMNRK
ncbi:MAG: PDDEXK nuclease domain-containing protein [Chitinispirillia bacterium]|nr:PDDEXK nuclease domain-containing protein [Chitinispirillia bacterium]